MHTPKKICLIGLIVLSFVFDTKGQMQHPPSVNWKSIKTKDIKIVFPEQIAQRGQQVAALMDSIMGPVSFNPSDLPRKINLFLFNQSVTSNGFVALAPRFSAWYTTPPQNVRMLGGGNWDALLANHEYRHVAQYAKLNNNFTKFMAQFFGQTMQAGLNTIAVPRWYYEGDAICIETAQTNIGRGRIPAFNMGIRTILLNNKRLRYDQAYLGSYNHYFPDHYHLGYLMAGHIRSNYGRKTTEKLLERGSKRSYSPFSFARSLKLFTGHNLKHTYRNTMNELDSLWTKHQDNRTIEPANYWDTPSKRTWTNYSNPQLMDNQSVVAVKQGLDDAPQLVRINGEGEEHHLAKIPSNTKISGNGNTVVWTQPVYDPRWNQRSYSDIFAYNLNTHQKTRCTFQKKYFAPSLSPNGNKIAAVAYGPELVPKLVVLEKESGEVLSEFVFDTLSFIRTPSWSSSGNRIVFTYTIHDKIGIKTVNITTQKQKTIIPPKPLNIGNPEFYNPYVLYNTPKNHVGAIYAVHTETGEKHEVYTGRYGSYNPDIKNDIMVFQDYTVSGYQIARQKLEPEEWSENTNKTLMPFPYTQTITQQVKEKKEYYKPLTPNISDTNSSYRVEPFSPLLHAFNIHSWLITPSPEGVKGKVISKDELNTTVFSGGVEYNTNEKKANGFFQATYQGFYPAIDVKLISGYRTSNTEIQKANEEKDFYHWNENTLEIGAAVPLHFYNGIHSQQVYARAAYEYTKITDLDTYVYPYLDGHISSLSYEARYNHSTQTAPRDIYPPFAQKLRTVFKHTPFNTGVNASLFSVSGKLFFPGLLAHHSFQIGGLYEDQSPVYSRWKNYRYASEDQFIRGYDFQFHDRFYKLSLDYAFPLCYPDISIWSFFYFKRIRTDLFFDMGAGTFLNGTLADYKSVGADLLVDMHLFRLPFALNIGVRYSRRLPTNTERIEFLLMGMPITDL